jgi:hypothetical protein
MAIPTDDVELERLVARFARHWLDDPHAQRFGRQGQAQHGIDILATDRRRKVGEVWAFQAKCVAEFSSSDLDQEAMLLAGCPHTLHHYVVVTTAPRSARVQERAQHHSTVRGHPVVVWYWEHFAQHVEEVLGDGVILSVDEREALRQAWCRELVRDFETRSPLHPLRFAAIGDRRLCDLLIRPRLQQLADASSDRAGPIGSLAALIADDAGGSAPVLLVSSVAGSGKSTLLASTAAELALAAQQDTDAPLPVLVSAAELAERGVQGIVDAHAIGQPGPLWHDPGTDWIVLVDGLDELAPVSQARAGRELRTLAAQARVVRVVASERSGPQRHQHLRGAVRLALEPWRPEDHQRFRLAWDPSAPSRSPGLPIQPLEATLLSAFELSPDVPGARWSARVALLNAVLEEWSVARPGPEATLVRELLGTLALEALQDPSGAAGPETCIRSGIGGAARIVEQIGERTGILTVDGLGQVRFPLRLAGEALAAEALASGSVSDWAAACAVPRLAIAARLAGIARALASPDALTTLLRACLDHPTSSVRHSLRRLGVVIGMVNDLGALASPVLADVAQLLLREASDETSQWRRDVAGRWLADVAADGGPLWRCVREALGDGITAVPDREAMLRAWSEALDRGEVQLPSETFWQELLYEESAGVRALGVERIARQPESPERLQTLLFALLDPGHEPFSATAPAVAAGRAIRASELNRESAVIALQGVAASGLQIPAGAAAIGLRPGEAPPSLVLHALRGLWMADHVEEVVAAVAELRGEPEVEQWINVNWPEANALVAWEKPLRHQVPAGPGAPPSGRVRAHLLRCIAAGVAETDEWRQLPPSAKWDAGLLASLSRSWMHFPGRLAPLFREMVSEGRARRAPPFLPPAVQDALGAAALGDRRLSDALVEWWSDDIDVRSSYPGVALEALVITGNAEAGRVYAEWLPHTPFMMPLGGYHREPAPLALQVPEIAAAARRWSEELWCYASLGREGKDGAVQYLHPQSLGAALRGLSPVWGLSTFKDELMERAATGDSREWFVAGIEAFLPSGLPRPLANAVVQRLTAWRSEASSDLEVLVSAADEGGLVREAEDVLRDIAQHVEGAPGWSAAAALMRGIPEADRSTISTLWASRFPRGLGPWNRSHEHVDLMVTGAPDAWVTAFERATRDHQWWAGNELVMLARVLLSRLRGELRDRTLAVVREMEWWQLPWVPGSGLTPFRVGDAASKLLYTDEGDSWT